MVAQHSPGTSRGGRRRGYTRQESWFDWLSADGTLVERTPPAPGRVDEPRLSPDERTIVTWLDVPSSAEQVWKLDLASGSWSPLAAGAYPVWLPDGRDILFRTAGPGGYAIARLPVDRSAEPVEIAHGGEGETLFLPTSVSPDGEKAVVDRQPTQKAGDVDIWVLDLAASGKPDGLRPLVEGPGDQHSGCFSPDGRFLAYVSDETGREEVWVAALPLPGWREQVSQRGGEAPVWSRDGRSLFFVENNALVQLEAWYPHPAKPQPYATVRLSVAYRHPLEVTRDGRILLLSSDPRRAFDTDLAIIEGFSDSLRRLAPSE